MPKKMVEPLWCSRCGVKVIGRRMRKGKSNIRHYDRELAGAYSCPHCGKFLYPKEDSDHARTSIKGKRKAVGI